MHVRQTACITLYFCASAFAHGNCTIVQFTTRQLTALNSANSEILHRLGTGYLLLNTAVLATLMFADIGAARQHPTAPCKNELAGHDAVAQQLPLTLIHSSRL